MPTTPPTSHVTSKQTRQTRKKTRKASTAALLPTLLLAAGCQAAPTAPSAAPPIVTAEQAAQPTPHPLAGQTVGVPEPTPAGQVDLPRYPAISPDGQTVVFSWRGDLWSVNRSANIAPTQTTLQATRLTVHPGLDIHPTFRPDGKAIAFNSDRDGGLNIYTMGLDGSHLEAITQEDQPLFLHQWLTANNDADASGFAATSYREADVHKSPRPFLIPEAGGVPSRLHDAFGRSAAVSPDGKHIAFVRGRASWDRPYLTNSDNRDLWLYDTDTQTFTQLTFNRGHDGKPHWLDNQTLVYLSARPPARANLYKLDIQADTPEAKAIALTGFDANDVRDFDLAPAAHTAVLQVWDRLYTLDLQAQDATPTPLTITAPIDAGDTTIVHQLARNTSDAALSPDGKVLATVTAGDVYIQTLDSQNPPQRVTHTATYEHGLTWTPDGQQLVFVGVPEGASTQAILQASVTLQRSDLLPKEVGEPTTDANNAEDTPEEATADETESTENRDNQAADEDTNNVAAKEEAEKTKADNPWLDALRFETTALVETEHADTDPVFANDGQTLAFRRDGGDIVLKDLNTQEETVFFDHWDRRSQFTFTPDGQHLAITVQDQDHNADIWLAPIDQSWAPINLTQHPAFDHSPVFSADGKAMAFLSARNGDQYDVHVVYLDRSLESLSPQALVEHFKQATKDASKQAENKYKNKEDASEENTPAFAYNTDDLQTAFRHLRRVTRTDESESDLFINPAGDTLYFKRGNTLFKKAHTGPSDDQKENNLADNVGNVLTLSTDGKTFTAVINDTPATITTSGGKLEKHDLSGSIRVDRQTWQHERFRALSQELTNTFYDGSFKGIDWPSITEKYGQLAERAWTFNTFDDVVRQYFGQLNASHMGVYSPKDPTSDNIEANGYLGVQVVETTANGQPAFRITAIEPETPAATGDMQLHIGDVITAIDFVPIQPGDTLNARLKGRIGLETALTVQPATDESDEATETTGETVRLLTPISFRGLDAIRYNNWQRHNQNLVSQWSDGRLGYIHIEAMNEASMAEYERDLYAACVGKDGLIIDVRDNGGGWTTDRLLSSIMAQRHAYTVPRDADPSKTNSYPVDRLFIPRYNLPINTLCNQHSFSNAEIFSHAFKTLGRGTLVGEQTAGGVISTGSASFPDGTRIRIPFRGWYLTNDRDMENNGAMPDLHVPQTPQDEATQTDSQLKAAVDDLLKRL